MLIMLKEAMIDSVGRIVSILADFTNIWNWAIPWVIEFLLFWRQEKLASSVDGSERLAILIFNENV